MSFLRDGLEVVLSIDGQFLMGATDHQSVTLTGNPTDGTVWIAHGTEPVFSFECSGRGFLDGNTQSGVVGLRPNDQPPFTGTKWRVADLPESGSHATLQCKGTGGGRFTDGFLLNDVLTSSIGLTPGNTFPTFAAMNWELIVAPISNESGGGDLGNIVHKNV